LIGRFESPTAYRQSLEQRLLSSYGSRGVNQARKRLAIERLVVRLQEQRPSGFIAKGGFALELRLTGVFRGTRDLDIAAEPDLTADVDAVSDEIESACAIPVPDGFEFQLSGDPDVVAAEEDARTLRYLALARLDGRLFERVPLDVRVGDIIPPRFDELPGSDLLGFAGLPRPRLRIIPLEYHFAEKVHAYAKRRETGNTRIRDLVDMHALIGLGLPAGAVTAEALRVVFEHRGTHPFPVTLAPPPGGWAEGFALLARSMPGVPEDMTAAYKKVASFYSDLWR